ncbi:MAG: hypothetical protein A2939_03100 [Parcubacteria group bacterium RIFCSPLOWO2_01_FULL_48_18]|nr:MAG: hypothetical protein A2939_03100 [Parcubacteria group bacterium RIFCSPLOWO2_01_FULL_48_18]OHB23274.1 MAG: hypothetical protein A3J67_04245 [Parcubacteria group bacterium RIFCSPHIGHO2_02_FULL_48_10b]
MLDKAYDPKNVEREIYARWEKSGYFNPDKLPKRGNRETGKRRNKPYVILMPLPNVTGSLHIGHVLDQTIQDLLTRWHRMRGFRALWLPGTDHAGIATQNVVEKELRKQGVSRFGLGREKFIEKTWEWKQKYGAVIENQERLLGNSCDWSRNRFTMDPAYAEAVKNAFTHYYNKGLIYRGKRVVNWCTRCGTSLSELEIEYKEEKARLYYIRYPIENESGNYIVVATTRPETMLGDCAVAVHSKDARYTGYVGKNVLLPIHDRLIPIITDKGVEQDFGTGAVKVTPSHDMLDAEIAERHTLPFLDIINERGRMTAHAGELFEDLKTDECRERVTGMLREKNLIEKEEEYSHNLAICYRCGGALEPQRSNQWFVRMRERPRGQKTQMSLREMAYKAVQSGKVKILPKNYEKPYFAWLKDIKDWCVSRQIWWGHRIPAWYCGLAEARLPVMGFNERIVPQVLGGKKTKTHRVRDHRLNVGDKVAFENSQTKALFGYGIITEIEQTRVADLVPMTDPSHGTLYKTTKDIITAFKRYNPDRKVTLDTIVITYTYSFTPITEKHSREGCGNILVSSEKPKKCPACGGTNLTQTPDVLDTWFSSALWPFAARSKRDLEQYYPTDVLVTARDILNLWVARMIFSGTEFKQQPPFHTVLIHGTVLTKEGKRMSKSLGTGVDPLMLIEQYGTDALRFAVIWQSMGQQDIRWSEEALIAGKKFANKLWNASRFVLMRLDGKKATKKELGSTLLKFPARDKNASTIYREYKRMVQSMEKDIAAYRLGHALHRLYDFFWHRFCDRAIEEFKDKEGIDAKLFLLALLVEQLKILHPFMPFATEYIYSFIPITDKNLLMVEQIN